MVFIFSDDNRLRIIWQAQIPAQKVFLITTVKVYKTNFHDNDYLNFFGVCQLVFPCPGVAMFIDIHNLGGIHACI